MKNILIIILCSFIGFFSLCGQDAHFSQWNLGHSLRNPASIGQSECNQQLSASYRSQWTTIPSAFRNMSVGYEQKKSKFAWGLNILNNDAGEASLQTTQLTMDFAYRKQLSAKGEMLSIGASGGVIQQRFKPELFQFDNQYVEGSGFDPDLSNGESFSKTSHYLPSMTVGAMVNKYLNRIKVTAGLSFAHINQPNAWFYENGLEKYPMRTSFFASTELPLKEGLKGELNMSYSKQGVALEKIAGVRIKYQLTNQNWLNLGVGNRFGDALILEGGLKMKHTTLAISYDMNNSGLTGATKSKGAIELSLTYCFNRKHKHKQHPVASPVIEMKMDNKNKMIPDQPSSVQPTKEKDSDGDGIIDSLDECPKIPGLRYFNGCNDADRDGVWDSRDACPHLYGQKENQGCPMSTKDTDKDGLIDDIDKCPFIQGAAELGGCPDTDKDGISDMEDYCPFMRGVKENNGCPKMNKQEHQDYIQNKSISTIVEFDTDQSFIKAQFYLKLDEVVEFMLEHKDAKAYVSGHTDFEGDKEYNFKLGERRSGEVMEYLMKRGISYTRMVPVSFGETKPVRSNASDFGKARNRRVEVTVHVN